jgi:anti-sigma regulatory factor (Ser/Thr protein kinase)
MTSREFELPPQVDSIAHARALVRELDLDQDVAEDAELLVSELVTNAVRHGGPAIRLLVDAADGALTIRVYDAGIGMPTRRQSAPDVPGGRGLQMVQRVASAWGVDVEPDGKTVWFTIERDRQATG